MAYAMHVEIHLRLFELGVEIVCYSFAPIDMALWVEHCTDRLQHSNGIIFVMDFFSIGILRRHLTHR